MSRLIAHWAFDEGIGKATKEQINEQWHDIDYVFNDATDKPSSDPLWRQGIEGNCLLFDGYSTSINCEGLSPKSLSEMTIEAWVAPRSFEYGADGKLSAIINQHNQDKHVGFLLGIYRHGTWSFQVGTGDEWLEVWDEGHPLPPAEWSHIAAVFSPQHGYMSLYLNGEQIATKKIKEGSKVVLGEEDLVIGKHNHPFMIEDVFSLNMYNGLLDELKIYDGALSPIKLLNHYARVKVIKNEIPEIPYNDLVLNREVYEGDRHRPRYHLIPPGHWMNEPHAPIFFKGKYHIFYQHNPKGPYWHYIHWGHLVSDDLVHWHDMPIALTPESGEVDPDGVWSGSACYDEFGVPALFFTAGNDAVFPNQMTGLARSTYSEDGDVLLTKWKKVDKPVTLQTIGVGMKIGDFRDPFVWKEDELWYQLVGTSHEDGGGTAALYTSSNLIDWKYQNLFYKTDHEKYPYLGPIWELPVFLPIGEDEEGNKKYVFLISPVGEGADVEVFYWIGVWDKEHYRFVPDQEEPQLIDVGDFHFTGPSGFIDPKTDRAIVFTITQGQRTLQEEYNAGWAHNGGLPLELYLRHDGGLGVRPIEEITSLRSEKLINLENVSVIEANRLLAEIQSDSLEIQLVLKLKEIEEVGMSVKMSPDKEEETYLYYNRSRSILGVNREKTTLNPLARTKGIQEGKLEIQEELLSLQLFLDKSMIELYVNEQKSLTTRSYPTNEEALGLELRVRGKTDVVSLKVWSINGAYE
ncbi:GH32 C-terminal domain-containing protein [Fictibacillus sp. 18YEL24]|uniref:GH32 C-terminal domain-containing protein n=1 Tax=Fictibacillus sp. 18YEL24 TaxID=2745875 RepID=UPI0018CDF877|nr:GH32 C-terminal domain-containing protein [Fictibacillus sp. 18YEL24]MBH0168329.1 GH32 C-terminal domain-containing protein [Fictibacillus sp. 18YEL24]